MRFFAPLVACVGIALTAAGCDPVTERRYFTEGAGVDLYTADRANQVELQNQYIAFVCDQAGPACASGNWTAFVQAGMNDIDQRCDGFLLWLDARRRDKEPVLGEISALSTATHAIMTVSGASPKSLDIVTAAFGLATQTYINWNSRLLISVNQSTVQTVVYSGQTDFRQKINGYSVPDQPTAIYLLRNYLRICMPTTIEAEINTTPTLVQRGNPMDAKDNPIVNPVRPAIIRNVNAPIQSLTPSQPQPGRVSIGPFEKRMSQKDLKRALDILGCPGTDFGLAGSPARKALAKFLIDNGKPSSDRVTNDVFFNLRDLKADGKQGTCSG
jgi:hypothetical protein